MKKIIGLLAARPDLLLFFVLLLHTCEVNAQSAVGVNSGGGGSVSIGGSGSMSITGSPPLPGVPFVVRSGFPPAGAGPLVVKVEGSVGGGGGGGGSGSVGLTQQAGLAGAAAGNAFAALPAVGGLPPAIGPLPSGEPALGVDMGKRLGLIRSGIEEGGALLGDSFAALQNFAGRMANSAWESGASAAANVGNRVANAAAELRQNAMKLALDAGAGGEAAAKKALELGSSGANAVAAAAAAARNLIPSVSLGSDSAKGSGTGSGGGGFEVALRGNIQVDSATAARGDVPFGNLGGKLQVGGNGGGSVTLATFGSVR